MYWLFRYHLKFTMVDVYYSLPWVPEPTGVITCLMFGFFSEKNKTRFYFEISNIVTLFLLLFMTLPSFAEHILFVSILFLRPLSDTYIIGLIYP